METYKKVAAETYELVVESSGIGRHTFFLRESKPAGYPELLDFFWKKKGKTKASVTFAISATREAFSLPQSPFGGFWVHENLTSEALEAFLGSVVAELRKRGVGSISLTQAPKCYEPFTDLIESILFKLGFSLDQVSSHQFFVGKKKIKRFAQKEQAKYHQKAKQDGLKVVTIGIKNFEFLNQIRSWNEQRGYQVSFDLDRLINQVSEYPDRYILISIFKDNQAIAHSVGVRLLENSIYYYLSASNPKSQIKNLGELIVFALIEYAADKKIEMIDLGSSEVDREINHSLMFFKSRFSNEIANKKIWKLNY